MANTNVTIRMDEDLKREADALFEELGMSFTTAVNVFVRQALRESRIPFEITLEPRGGAAGGGTGPGGAMGGEAAGDPK